LALLRRDGKCAVARAAVTPALFCGQPRFRTILAAVGDDAVALLAYAAGNGDARAAASQLTRWETTVGLCDADLTNAAALAADLGWVTDAAASPRLLLRLVNEACTANGEARLARGVAERLRLAEGPFAVVAWDRRFPETLIVARAGGSLFAFVDEPTGVVHFTNRPSHAAGLFREGGAVSELGDNTLRRYDPYSVPGTETVALFPLPGGRAPRAARNRPPELAGATPAR